MLFLLSFLNTPQYVTDAFITLGEIECIKTESSVLSENIILLNQINDSLADKFIALMKVRLIEFFKPKATNDSANKQLLFELQNFTGDFLVLNHEGNPVLIAHQKLTQDATAFEQKNHRVRQEIEIPSSKNQESDNIQDDYCQIKIKKNPKLNNIN